MNTDLQAGCYYCRMPPLSLLAPPCFALLSSSILPKRKVMPRLTKVDLNRWLPVVWYCGAVVLLPHSDHPKMSLTFDVMDKN